MARKSKEQKLEEAFSKLDDQSTTEKEKEGKTDKSSHLLKPGESLPGRGRPKGSKNRKTVIEAAIQADLVDALESDAMEIYNKAAQMAKEGDKTMIKMFLNRLLPELKASGEGQAEGGGHGGVHITINSTNPDAREVNGITITQSEPDNED